MLTFASGYTLGVPFVDPLIVREEQRNVESSLWLLPARRVFDEMTLVFANNRSYYSAKEMAEFSKDIGYEEGIYPYETRKEQIAMARVYCYCVYQSWKARNAKIHGDAIQTPTIIAAYIMGSVTNNKLFSFQEQWGSTQPDRLNNVSSWCPPPPGWLKINVDGALASNYIAAVGMVVRDDAGEVVFAAGLHMLHWDVVQVELGAVKFIGRNVQDWMLECPGIIIEGDNGAVISFLRNSMDKDMWKNNIINSLDYSFLSQFRQVIFRHVNRSSNAATDFCAARALLCSFVWESPSLFEVAFSRIIKVDKACLINS